MSAEVADYFSAVGKVVLDRYEAVRVAGEGGMAAVYEGRDWRLSRSVALKFLKVQQLEDVPSAIARFDREAELLAQLDHPNIVRVLDVGTFGDAPVLVMEWLEGESLADRLQRAGLMDWRTALRYTLPVVKALAAAHAQGIVHRDIKPPNVYIRRDDEVRLLDFGVARIYGHTEAAPAETTVARKRRITRTGLVLGTPHFVSPEQWRAEELDGRSDVYAVGVMLYLVMSGIPLWPTNNFMEIIKLVGLDEPQDLTSRVAALPAHVAELVRKCLEKDRRNRMSAIELVSDLERCLQAGDGPLVAAPDARTLAALPSALNTPTLEAKPAPVENQAKGPSATDALRDFLASPPPASTSAPRTGVARRHVALFAVVALLAVGGIAIGIIGLTHRQVSSTVTAPPLSATPTAQPPPTTPPPVALPSEAPVAKPPLPSGDSHAAVLPAPTHEATHLKKAAHRGNRAPAPASTETAKPPSNQPRQMNNGVFDPFGAP